MTIANLKTAVAKMTPGPLACDEDIANRIGAMEPVKVKLPQRYEDSDGNLCLGYAAVVAALKAAGIEVEP
jgi:hypothetical protein